MPAEKILLVDDEKLVRWSLRERLSSEGFEVDEAKNLAAAEHRMSYRDQRLHFEPEPGFGQSRVVQQVEKYKYVSLRRRSGISPAASESRSEGIPPG